MANKDSNKYSKRDKHSIIDANGSTTDYDPKLYGERDIFINFDEDGNAYFDSHVADNSKRTQSDADSGDSDAAHPHSGGTSGPVQV
jgi:hypothetical protein